MTTEIHDRNNGVAEINRLHRECCQGMRITLEKAITCGKLLTTQKEKCGHGKWEAWIKANLEFGDRQARRYMRCYNNREKLPKRTSKSDFTSMEEFLKLTEEPKEVVAELVEEPKTNSKRLAETSTYAHPLALGGKPLPMMPRRIPTTPQPVGNVGFNRNRMREFIGLALRYAQLGGITEDEFDEAVRSLKAVWFNQTTNKDG